MRMVHKIFVDDDDFKSLMRLSAGVSTLSGDLTAAWLLIKTASRPYLHSSHNSHERSTVFQLHVLRRLPLHPGAFTGVVSMSDCEWSSGDPDVGSTWSHLVIHLIHLVAPGGIPGGSPDPPGCLQPRPFTVKHGHHA